MKIVSAHRIISKPVIMQVENLEFVRNIIGDMLNLCRNSYGIHAGAYALAHCQVEDKNPLRFFIHRSGFAVVNPIITRATLYPVASEEACMSFPYKEKTIVPRSRKITVDYSLVSLNGDVVPCSETITGQMSFIFQHEIDHFDGKYILDKKEGS